MLAPSARVRHLCHHAPKCIMTESRRLLQHFLASLAYRTQKALRGAPETFSDFRAAVNVRTPHELIWHMTGVIGYARTMIHGGRRGPLVLHAVRWGWG